MGKQGMLNKALSNEIEIFHLIYLKFRSQQRNQRWWRYVSMTHRRLIRILQKDRADLKQARFLIKKLIPSLARALHSVLAQGAFITLGFALLACTARIYTLLDKEVGERRRRPSARHALPIVDPGTDLGIEVKPEAETDYEPNRGRLAAGLGIKSDKPKKKKKSKKAAIDDIFG